MVKDNNNEHALNRALTSDSKAGLNFTLIAPSSSKFSTQLIRPNDRHARLGPSDPPPLAGEGRCRVGGGGPAAPEGCRARRPPAADPRATAAIRGHRKVPKHTEWDGTINLLWYLFENI